jgi:hypothetical protein
VATLYEQRNLSMTPEQWSALEQAAVQTNSRSTRGPDAYQHSWRKLIQRIADGDFHLTEKEPYKIPDGLDRAIRNLQKPVQRLDGQLSLLEAEPA